MQGDQQQTQESAPVRAGRVLKPAIPGATKKPQYRGQNLTSQELLALRAKGQDYQTSTDDIIDDADEIRRRAYQDQLKEGSTKLDGVKPTREPRAKGGRVRRVERVSDIFDDKLIRLRGVNHGVHKKGSAYIGVNDGAGGSELSLARKPRAKRGRGRPRKSVRGGFPFLPLITTLLPTVLPLIINGAKWVIDKITGKKKQVAAGIPSIPRPLAYENPIWHLRPHTTGGIPLIAITRQKQRREYPIHIDRRTPGIVDPATLVPDMPSRRIRRTPTGIQGNGDCGFPLTIWDVEGGPVDDEIEGNSPGTERMATLKVLKQDHETPINALFNLVDYFMKEVIPDANMSMQEVLKGDDGGEEVGYWKSMFANTETSYKTLYNIAKEQGLLKSIFQLPKSHVMYRVVDFDRAKGEWVLEDSVPLAPIGVKPLIGSGPSRMPYHLMEDRSSSRMIPRGGAHPIFDTVPPYTVGPEAARIRMEWMNKRGPHFVDRRPRIPLPPGPFGRGEDDDGDGSEVFAAIAELTARKKPAPRPLRWFDGYGDLQAIRNAYKNPRKAGERMLKVAGSKEFAEGTSLEKIRLIVRSELEAIIPKILKSAFNEHEIEEHFDHKQMIEDVLNHVLPKGLNKFECDNDSSDDEAREGSGVPRGGAIDMKSFIVPLASWATHKTLKEAGMVVDKQAIRELAMESAGAIDFYGKGATGFYGNGDIEMLMDGQGIIDVIKKVRDFAKHIAMDILPNLVGVAASAMKPTIKKVLENTSFGKQHPMLLSLIADVVLGIVQSLTPATKEEKEKRAKEEKKLKDEEKKKEEKEEKEKKKKEEKEEKEKKKDEKKKKGKKGKEDVAPAAAGADTEILDALAAEVGDQKKT